MKLLLYIIYLTLITFSSSFANIKIVTSTYPIALLVKDITTNSEIEVDYIIPKEQSPHDYSFKPSDIKKINAADFYIALGHMSHIKDIKAKVINISSDDHLIYNISNSKQVTDYVTDNISYCGNKDKIRLASAALKQKLENIGALARKNLANHKNKAYLAVHDTLSGFAEEYGILSYGSILPEHEESLKPSHLKKIKELLTTNKVSCIFYEDDSELKLIENMVPNNFKKVKISTEKFSYQEFDGYDKMILYIYKQFNKCFE